MEIADFPRSTADSAGNTLLIGAETIELYSNNGLLLSQHYAEDAGVSKSGAFNLNSPTPYIVAAGITQVRMLSASSDYATIATLDEKNAAAVAACYIDQTDAATERGVALLLLHDGAVSLLSSNGTNSLRVSVTLTAADVWGAGAGSWMRGRNDGAGLVAAPVKESSQAFAVAWGGSSSTQLAVIHVTGGGALSPCQLWTFAVPIASATIASVSSDDAVIVTVVTQDGAVAVRIVHTVNPASFVPVDCQSTASLQLPLAGRSILLASASARGAAFLLSDFVTVLPVVVSSVNKSYVAHLGDAIRSEHSIFTVAWPVDEPRAISLLTSGGLRTVPVTAAVEAAIDASAGTVSPHSVYTAAVAALASMRTQFETAIANVSADLDSSDGLDAALHVEQRLGTLDSVAAAFYHRELAATGRVDPSSSAVLRSIERIAALRVRLAAIRLVAFAPPSAAECVSNVEQWVAVHVTHAATAKAVAHQALALDNAAVAIAIAAFHDGGFWTTDSTSLCARLIAAASSRCPDASAAAYENPSVTMRAMLNDTALAADVVFALYCLYVGAFAPRQDRVKFAHSLNCPTEYVDLAYIARIADCAPSNVTTEVVLAASSLAELRLGHPLISGVLSQCFVAFTDAGNVACAAALTRVLTNSLTPSTAVAPKVAMRLLMLSAIRADIEPLIALNPHMASDDSRALLISAACAVANARGTAEVVRGLISTSHEIDIAAALLAPRLSIQLLVTARQYARALAVAEHYRPAAHGEAERHAELLSRLRALTVADPTESRRWNAGTTERHDPVSVHYCSSSAAAGVCVAASASILRDVSVEMGSSPIAPVDAARALPPLSGLKSLTTVGGHRLGLPPLSAAETMKCSHPSSKTKLPCGESRPCPYHD